MERPFLITLAVLTVASAKLTAADQNSLAFDPQEFADLQTLIKPASDEAQWSQVSWMPSSNIWAARQKAAAEGKPLFLWYIEPSHYHLWLTEPEWKSIVVEAMKLKEGDQFPVPDGIQKRIFRYHLLNGTFGLPGAWRLDDIRAGGLTLKVEAVSPIGRLRLNGSALLANNPNLDKAERGYDTRLHGLLEYDPARKAITRFDIVAIGDYWGGHYEGGRFKRPGRTPLGIAFELARGDSAADLAPPLVHMDREEMSDRYFAAERR